MNDAQLLAELDEYMPSFAGEPAEWSDVIRRARRPHRRRLMIASIAVALIVVPAALAFGSKLVVDLFEGTPASPHIRQDYITFNGSFTPAIENKFSVHPVDISQIHGVLAIQTTEGPVYLWSAPEQGGGACFFVEYADELGPDAGGCDTAASPNAKNILPGSYWTRSHAPLQIIYGYTYGDATSVEVDLANGSTLRLPVTEQYFLAAIDANAQISRIVSYDAQNNQVGEATLTTLNG
jgi:hypothetical protein